jgi:hypothetical protein
VRILVQKLHTVLNLFSMDHQRRIIVGRGSLACMRSLACVSSFACRGGGFRCMFSVRVLLLDLHCVQCTWCVSYGGARHCAIVAEPAACQAPCKKVSGTGKASCKAGTMCIMMRSESYQSVPASMVTEPWHVLRSLVHTGAC